ncbi:DUF952 domain-containing protein [Planotetraspora kaengkrachanensis]|uniref:DUF952 domain-containing protein n=1 Tax=Planotetraspora kaengkrachanensis TaxID=575193 RepID=A0A8J3PYP0_9ACTN|nr:DUF952 domain-containing protein [Planotetraspora kaengkrachanensis]GIG83520.1 hypothetical protein Pka01_66470 [Planotetraspora kaengkrachanensis]
MIFHLALVSDWEQAQGAGEYRMSTLGRTLDEEGFIHASADLAQAEGVARRFYLDVTEPLVLLAVDESLLGSPVKFEVPEGTTEAFPHIYGPIPTAAVTTATPFTPGV